MKIPFFLFALISLVACQSNLSPTEKILQSDNAIKIASATTHNLPKATFVSDKSEWYANLNELENFENFEEENGILLGEKLSVATYSTPKDRQSKLLVLEEIRHLKNGEARFRKLDMVKIELEKYQFLTTDFCQLENNPKAAILAVYESGGEIAYAKNFIKAFQINLQKRAIQPIATTGVKCFFE